MNVQRITTGSVLLLAAGSMTAGTITVTSDSGDHNVADACVLRDAIATANSGAATGACTIEASPPPTATDAPDCLCTANTIVLPAGATITLTEVDDVGANTGLPPITASLTITGSGSTIRRDPALGCNHDGVNDAGEFALLSNGSSPLVLDHLTLSNGCADSADYAFAKGGAISNSGALVLQHVVLSDNWASNRGGALYDDGFGGGAGAVTISDSTFTGNGSQAGAGIFVEGSSATLAIQRSLFAQNAASPYFAGGGIETALGTSSRIVNSTFSANSAGAGGAIEADGVVDVSSSTFAENSTTGGGAAFQISTSGAGQQAIIKNSLFAANSGGSCAFATGDWSAHGANLSDDASCSGFTLPSTAAGLLPLADNGGPTLTHALQTTSAAVDAASDCLDLDGFTISVDQRGYPRPVAIVAAGPQCDLGAFELGDDVFHDGFDGAAAN